MVLTHFPASTGQDPNWLIIKAGKILHTTHSAEPQILVYPEGSEFKSSDSMI
jgi:hypothetical protein